jgi:hypothetical protein
MYLVDGELVDARTTVGPLVRFRMRPARIVAVR